MRIGCTLPTFRRDPAGFLEVARAADRAGIDGVFAFEHLWPMRQPGKPSVVGKLALAAAAAVTSRVAVGTLVARVGLVPDETLLAELAALHAVSGGRLIAGLGVGDSLSDDENEAYGVPPVPAEDRWDSLERVAGTLRTSGIETWIGGGSARTNAVARRVGVALNLWDAGVGVLRAAARTGETTFGGPMPSDPGEAAERMGAIADAGATFLVWAWPGSVELLVEARRRSGLD